MSVRVSVSVSASDFVLERLLAEHSGTPVRLDRIAAFDESLVPYLWVAEPNTEATSRALREDPDVEAFEVIDTFGCDTLIRVGWTSDAEEFVEGLAESGAVLVEAVSDGTSWSLELRFPDHDRLSEFHAWCLDYGIDLSVGEVYSTNGTVDEEGPLTDVQRETLYAALDAGYFEIPRAVTLTELADDLGVSDNAVSQRLRRGISALVRRQRSMTDTGS
jgi:predicted DNA binding protein